MPIILTLKIRERGKVFCDGRFRKAALKLRKMSVQFPSFDKNENLRFTRYVRLMEIIWSNMMCGHGDITKRQIFYTDVALFRKQRIVDEYIDIIAECFGVSIHILSVVAAQKGLIFGNIELSYKGTPIFIKEDQGPCLIPQISLNSEYSDFTFNNVGVEVPKEIMVIEKEAIFKSLCVTLRGKGVILITGKGFPDRLTRIFLHFLCHHFETTPVRAYVDSDVYGIMIFNQFKYVPAICKKRKMIKTEMHQKETNEPTEREEYKSSCSRLLYGGVRLFGNQVDRIKDGDKQVVAFHYLQISERNMVSMQRLLGRMINKRERDEQTGETRLNGTAFQNNKDFEITKVIREVQLGMFFMLKREMQEAE